MTNVEARIKGSAWSRAALELSLHFHPLENEMKLLGRPSWLEMYLAHLCNAGNCYPARADPYFCFQFCPGLTWDEPFTEIVCGLVTLRFCNLFAFVFKTIVNLHYLTDRLLWWVDVGLWPTFVPLSTSFTLRDICQQPFAISWRFCQCIHRFRFRKFAKFGKMSGIGAVYLCSLQMDYA